MKIYNLVGLLAVIMFLYVNYTPHVYAQITPEQLDLAAIDQYIHSEMERDNIPGVALAIVHNEQIVAVRGYGEAGNGQPVTAETGFILGSMSKSFTALAVMQLVEQDLIELDAPVVRYLPWFKTADTAQSATITVRHLLNHTSGIPTTAPQADNVKRTLHDHVKALADVDLEHAPGTVHEYASPNYLVLGALIEQISGQAFADYLQQHIFQPLNMRHSYTDQALASQNGMAQGHRYWFGLPVAANLEYEADRMPTAAIISSGSDLANYLIAQLNNGKLGDQQVLQAASMLEMHHPNAQGDGFSYAMGWRVSTIAGVAAIHHGGVVPHFRGKMVLLPEQGWGVAILTNASTVMPLPIMPTSHRMADAIAGFLVGQPLSHNAYSQTLLYWAVGFGMALILLAQIKSLFTLKRWRSKFAQRSRRAMIQDAVIETVVPIAMIVGLPLVLGLPWRAIVQGTPDMALWLMLMVGVGLLTAGLKWWRIAPELKLRAK